MQSPESMNIHFSHTIDVHHYHHKGDEALIETINHLTHELIASHHKLQAVISKGTPMSEHSIQLDAAIARLKQVVSDSVSVDENAITAIKLGGTDVDDVTLAHIQALTDLADQLVAENIRLRAAIAAGGGTVPPPTGATAAQLAPLASLSTQLASAIASAQLPAVTGPANTMNTTLAATIGTGDATAATLATILSTVVALAAEAKRVIAANTDPIVSQLKSVTDLIAAMDVERQKLAGTPPPPPPPSGATAAQLKSIADLTAQLVATNQRIIGGLPSEIAAQLQAINDMTQKLANSGLTSDANGTQLGAILGLIAGLNNEKIRVIGINTPAVDIQIKPLTDIIDQLAAVAVVFSGSAGSGAGSGSTTDANTIQRIVVLVDRLLVAKSNSLALVLDSLPQRAALQLKPVTDAIVPIAVERLRVPVGVAVPLVAAIDNMNAENVRVSSIVTANVNGSLTRPVLVPFMTAIDLVGAERQKF